MICVILFKRFSDALPACACVSSIRNLCGICFRGSVLICLPWIERSKISGFLNRVVAGLNDSDGLDGVWC